MDSFLVTISEEVGSSVQSSAPPPQIPPKKVIKVFNSFHSLITKPIHSIKKNTAPTLKQSSGAQPLKRKSLDETIEVKEPQQTPILEQAIPSNIPSLTDVPESGRSSIHLFLQGFTFRCSDTRKIEDEETSG